MTDRPNPGGGRAANAAGGEVETIVTRAGVLEGAQLAGASPGDGAGPLTSYKRMAWTATCWRDRRRLL